jgi:hypothetical protein
MSEEVEQMTTRSHETIRVGLRRVIRDPDVKVKDRLEAIKLLMQVEGLMEAGKPNGKPVPIARSGANDQELTELYERMKQEPKRDLVAEPFEGLPET